MRQLEKSQAEVSSTYTTPRTLLSIIRLSMALAKLRFDTEVRGALISCVRFRCYPPSPPPWIPSPLVCLF